MIETSIVIRTKNEERWITKCLKAINNQLYKNYETIIVDNCSTDNTLQKLENFNIEKIISINKYKPGKSLNLGVKKAKGKFIVFVSSHCIPSDSNWLGNLINEIKSDNKIAGVYGRQIPMKFSSAQTKRDLLITFGLDRKIQINDSFFHNANSVIRKDVWKKIKFDEKVNNIEDRIWASKVLKKKYKIVYQPNAKVYHHHGIHHDLNTERSESTIKVLEKYYKTFSNELGKINPKDIDILTIVPFIGENIKINGQSLLKSTITYIKDSKYLSKIIVLTDNKNITNFCKRNGVADVVIRKKEHSKLTYDLSKIYSIYLPKIEKMGYPIDLIVSIQPNFLSRPKNLISDMIEVCLDKGFDTVIPVSSEYGVAWQDSKNNKYSRVDEGDYPRGNKNPLLISVKGLGFVTHPEILRKGVLIGKKCGLYKINKIYSSLEVDNYEDTKIFRNILSK
jgi:rhamnosyltransferase